MSINKPYHKVLILILISNFILFGSAFIVVNILIPSRFESDARKTIENEISFLIDDVFSEETYLSGAVQFIFSDEHVTKSDYMLDASYLKNYLDLQKLEKKKSLTI